MFGFFRKRGPEGGGREAEKSEGELLELARKEAQAWQCELAPYEGEGGAKVEGVYQLVEDGERIAVMYSPKQKKWMAFHTDGQLHEFGEGIDTIFTSSLENLMTLAAREGINIIDRSNKIIH